MVDGHSRRVDQRGMQRRRHANDKQSGFNHLRITRLNTFRGKTQQFFGASAIGGARIDASSSNSGIAAVGGPLLQGYRDLK